MISSTPAEAFRVAAFYRFAPVADPAGLRRDLRDLCLALGIRGTLIVAPEGINGTIAGTPAAIDQAVSAIRAVEGFEELAPKSSTAETMPFRRLKVRLKREIVTMGIDGLDPSRQAGTYVRPEDWNALIADPGTVLIDTRNAYETALGTFPDALDPRTAGFCDFPDWLRARVDAFKGKTVAMFCTGGIRCEKATAYARSLGIDDVRHLEGGILAYLEKIPSAESRWRGECFVFDERVGLTAALEQGEAVLCRACRHPLTPAEQKSPLFAEGMSCPHCHAARSDADRSRYAERHRQVALAETRGAAPHIGTRQD